MPGRVSLTGFGDGWSSIGEAKATNLRIISVHISG
jgi:hypothetical protein